MAGLVLFVTACSPSGPSPEEVAESEAAERRFVACGGLAEDVTETVQQYVDQFAPVEESADGELNASVPPPDALDEAAAGFQRRRVALGCKPREFQLQMQRALDELEAVGPVGRAVVAEVRDRLLERSGPAAMVTVAPGDDLAEAVHDAGPGAVVRLEPGRHELAEPLALLRPTILVGAGSDVTTVVSRAAGAVVLHLGQGEMDVEGVGFAHEGNEVASVLVAAVGSYRLRDVTVTGGVADDQRSSGWGLMLGGAPGQSVDRTEEVIGLRATDNDAGGIAVVGDRSPSLEDITADDNGGCGICFLGAGSAVLDGGSFARNQSGVSASDGAQPTLRDVTFVDNAEAAVLAAGDAVVEVHDATATGNGPLGFVVTGDAELRVQASTITGHTEAALLAEGGGRLVVEDVEASGSPLGLLVREQASGEVTALVVTEVTQTHVVFADDADGSISGGSCGGAGHGIVLLGAASVEVGDTACATVDQRD